MSKELEAIGACILEREKRIAHRKGQEDLADEIIRRLKADKYSNYASTKRCIEIIDRILERN